jgi:dTDP-4-dehydrorhamnose 3,5-epimerase
MTTPAQKDQPLAAPRSSVRPGAIDGVLLREGGNIVTRNGHTTEVFSSPWELPVDEVRHVIHVSLKPAAVSAWHMHRAQTDQIVPVAGMIRVVLYDPRENSPSKGRVDVFNLSPMRPTLLLIPPGIWHGVQNMIASDFSSFINLFDRPYEHSDPDEWRLPLRNDQIPYEFDAA